MNRTAVVILQHRRERFHPFNSARIVQSALLRCQLMVAHNADLAVRFGSMPLEEKVGLLYPGGDAQLLTELSPQERPSQLVVIDGTWHQAKTLLRDIPRLQGLPRYSLAPSSPSRYRIRREPNAYALSTLEATVAALSLIEPDTPGLDQLMDVFDRMIGDQLRSKSTNWRHHERRRGGESNTPRLLSGDLSKVVVAYGEREMGGRNQRSRDRLISGLPVYWRAKRLVSGEEFKCAIDSDSLRDPGFLNHAGLSADVIDDAVALETFRKRWGDFLRPNDRVTVYHESTARLLRNVDPDFHPALVLKTVRVDPQWRSLASPLRPVDRSRAASRLAKAIDLVNFLNSQAQFAS